MSYISLQEVKRGVLQKFFIEKGTENQLPIRVDSRAERENNAVMQKIAHRGFANTLLQTGLPDLQVALFRTLIEDVSIILRLGNWIKKTDNQEDIDNYLKAIGVVKYEMDFFTTSLATIDINSIKFDGINASGFDNFFNDLVKSYEYYYPMAGYAVYGGLPDYHSLVKKFLTAYLQCVNSFYIMLSKKAAELQELTLQDFMEGNKTEEDDLFFVETHNFFMSVLRYFAQLTYKYNNFNNMSLIEDINFLAELLSRLAKVYEGEISREEAKEFYEFIDGGNLVAVPPISSYYRKWLYKKANELQENVTRG